jgi:hypothetical protein
VLNSTSAKEKQTLQPLHQSTTMDSDLWGQIFRSPFSVNKYESYPIALRNKGIREANRHALLVVKLKILANPER